MSFKAGLIDGVHKSSIILLVLCTIASLFYLFAAVGGIGDILAGYPDSPAAIAAFPSLKLVAVYGIMMALSFFFFSISKKKEVISEKEGNDDE